MKREEFLIHLSHDHHHGLALARLLQTDSNGNPEQIDLKKKKLFDFFQSDLKGHFEKEESIFKLLANLDEKLDDLIEQIKEEHMLIEQLILSAELTIDSEQLLFDIGVLLKEHIRKEERILFPLIEEKVTEDIILKISKT